MKRKRGQAFDLGVTNILQESKKLGTAEQPTRPLSGGLESHRANCPIQAGSSDTGCRKLIAYMIRRYLHKAEMIFLHQTCGVRIGKNDISGNFFNPFFFGLIDDVRIYNVALSADEITVLAL